MARQRGGNARGLWLTVVVAAVVLVAAGLRRLLGHGMGVAWASPATLADRRQDTSWREHPAGQTARWRLLRPGRTPEGVALDVTGTVAATLPVAPDAAEGSIPATGGVARLDRAGRAPVRLVPDRPGPAGPAPGRVRPRDAAGRGPAGASTTQWVAPVGGVCPTAAPVKVKLSSGIFHVPGGAHYARTHPDRCYPSPEAAAADGFRAARTGGRSGKATSPDQTGA